MDNQPPDDEMLLVLSTGQDVAAMIEKLSETGPTSNGKDDPPNRTKEKGMK